MKNIVISLIAAVVVFTIEYVWSYRDILYHQTHEPMTSFPPSAAWLSALPYALAAFIGVGIASMLVSYLVFGGSQSNTQTIVTPKAVLAQYGQKIIFEKNQPITYPDFSIIYLGQEKYLMNSVSNLKSVRYLFDAYDTNKHLIAHLNTSPGSGDLTGPIMLNVGGMKLYEINFGAFFDETRFKMNELKENEMVVTYRSLGEPTEETAAKESFIEKFKQTPIGSSFSELKKKVGEPSNDISPNRIYHSYEYHVPGDTGSEGHIIVQVPYNSDTIEKINYFLQ